MRLRRWAFGASVVVVGLTVLGATGPRPSLYVPSPGSSVVVKGDGLGLGCGQVLPLSREVQGERLSADAPRPQVFIGKDLVMTNKGVSFPVVVWWVYRGYVVWTVHMGPYKAGPFAMPRGYRSDSVVELGPATWPGWDAVSVSFGATCVGGRAHG